MLCAFLSDSRSIHAQTRTKRQQNVAPSERTRSIANGASEHYFLVFSLSTNKRRCIWNDCLPEKETKVDLDISFSVCYLFINISVNILMARRRLSAPIMVVRFLVMREKKSILLVFVGFLFGQLFGRTKHSAPCPGGVASPGRVLKTYRDRMNSHDTSSTTTTNTAASSTTTSSQTTNPGWNSVDVFYGSTDLVDRHFPRNKNGKHLWFSQVKQDQIVSALFRGKQSGFFIDLASNDAVEISNTFALERFYGWCVLENFGSPVDAK